MLIFIRSGKPYKKIIDFPLDEEEKTRCKKVALALSEKYGQPYKIYSSPYQQCLDTMLKFEEVAKTNNVKIEKDLSCFNKDSVSEVTKVYKPPLKERKRDFRKRCKDMLKSLHSYIKEDKVIWIVTHGHNLHEFAKILKIDLPHKHIEYLSSFCLSYE